MAANISVKIQNFGQEVYKSAQDLVTGKTYSKFNSLSKDAKIDVITKTALVAFAAGIIGSVLFSQFALTAVVVGVLGFAFSTRETNVNDSLVSNMVQSARTQMQSLKEKYIG